MSSWQLIFIQSKVNNEYMTEIGLSRRIGNGTRRLGFKLGCANFAETIGNTPNSQGNSARKNSNLPVIR